MNRSLHLTHKILLLALLLLAFALPFILAGTGSSPDSAVLQAGAGVLQANNPAPQQPSTNQAAAINTTAGRSLTAEYPPLINAALVR